MNAIDWKLITESMPDDDLIVLLFDKHASEPVWPGYHDGTQFVYAEGLTAKPTHWAELPWGPKDFPQAERVICETRVTATTEGYAVRPYDGLGNLCEADCVVYPDRESAVDAANRMILKPATPY